MTTIKSILEELWQKAYMNPGAEWKRPQERESDISHALQQIEQLISHEIIDRRPHNAKVLSDHWEDVEFV